MIDINTLKEIGKLKNMDNIGFVEKDYLQEIALLVIYRNFDFFVFKGGTALYKFYKLDRFSEDLDFAAIKEFNLEHFLHVLMSGLEKYGVKVNKIIHKRVSDSFLIKLSLVSILYDGSTLSHSSLRIDINVKSGALHYSALTLNSLYPDIPSFEIFVMSKEEILSEKIRAIMTRKKARDIYDLWFLLKDNTKIDLNMINSKLEYYKKSFNFNEFNKRLNLKKEMWEKELKVLIPCVPSFSEVKSFIQKHFGKVKK